MKRPVLALLVLALTVGGYFLTRDDDAAILTRQLRRIETMGSHQSGEGQIPRQARAANLRELFTPDTSLLIRIPDHGERKLSNREELMDVVRQVKAGVDAMRLEFLDPKVTVFADRRVAEARTTLRATIGENANSQQLFVELKVQWRREDGNWAIEGIETIRTVGR
ncbi:MAG: nuclear transport factor 2 family protein [Verrucomicrobia bacterium]|nr:nuclear transport factor 2 family protein [Verrucomicrobiota bacterium]